MYVHVYNICVHVYRIGPTSNKSDDCIHIYFPLSGQPVESNQIPQPNQLSRFVDRGLSSIHRSCIYLYILLKSVHIHDDLM